MPRHNTSCPSCDKEIEVEIEPYIPARTYGLPEDCYPAEGGTIEPEHCPLCDDKLDTGLVYKEWADARRDDISDYAEGAD